MPTAFYQSTLKWNATTNMWDVALLDGTVHVFGENGPLQAIRDRFGNTVRLAHANGQEGNITQVTDPLTHVTTFEYDANGNRKSVTDALTHKTAGECQGSCRADQGAAMSSFTVGSGLSTTAAIRDQLRMPPDQRRGIRRRASS